MDAVKSFNDELSSIYESKPPISRAKMTLLTKKAIKAIKFYKHIVQSIEKFIQKCRPEYKVPGLYVIDSVVRQSRHQFGPEKDVFMPRLCKNILSTFQHIYKCIPEDKQRIIRVLNLWQKNQVFPLDIIQQLMVMGGAPGPGGGASMSDQKSQDDSKSLNDLQDKNKEPDASGLTAILTQLLANPDSQQLQQLTGLLSPSQQAQLQDLIKQVKNRQQPEDNNMSSSSKAMSPLKNEDHTSIFQPRETDNILPFLQSRDQPMEGRPPAFNRDVLDYDYSDDETSPKMKERGEVPQHSSGIDPTILAKLPTVDQMQQLTRQEMDRGSNHASSHPMHMDPKRLEHLKQEQANFDQQIQQMSGTFDSSSRNEPATAYSSRHGSRRSRSGSRSRHSSSRTRDKHRSRRSRSRSHDRSRRSRSRERKRSRRSRSSERRKHERERSRRSGIPPVKEGCISLCSTTIWIGNVASRVTQQELRTEVEAYGTVESINMIPPRGCAYICMQKREDAYRAIQKLKHTRLGSKMLKVDWAQGKEVKEEYKEFWNKDDGVNYIPLDKAPKHLGALKTCGFVDIESVPGERKAELTEEPEQVATANPAVNQPGEPPMLQSMASMMPNPQMPMMVRPGIYPNPYMPGAGAVPGPGQVPGFPGAMREAMTPEKSGKLTPTRDESGEIAVSMQQASPHPQAMTQQFPPMGQVPVQIRMLPGLGHPQMMQQRMGVNVMPIRMGMPMQFRPGFAQRLPARIMGPQIVGAFPQVPQQMAPMQMMRGPPPQENPGFVRPERPPNPMEEEPREMDQDKPPERNERTEPELPNRSEPMRFNGGHRGPPQEMRGPPPHEREREMMHERGRERDDRVNRGRSRERGGPPGRDRERSSRWGPPHEEGRDRDRRGGDDDFRRGGDRMRRGGDRDLDRMRDRDRDRDRGDRDRGDRGDRWGDRRDSRGGFRGGGRGGRSRGGRGGRGDFGGRGGGRGRFDDRRGGDRGGRFQPEEDEEEIEYRRKREEVLKQRHQDEEEYAVEEIDMSAFGLPSGFGGAKAMEPEEDTAAAETSAREDRDKRREWLDEKNKDRGDRDRRDDRNSRRDDRRRSRHDDRRRSPRRRSSRERSRSSPSKDEKRESPKDNVPPSENTLEQQEQNNNTEADKTNDEGNIGIDVKDIDDIPVEDAISPTKVNEHTAVVKSDFPGNHTSIIDDNPVECNSNSNQDEPALSPPDNQPELTETQYNPEDEIADSDPISPPVAHIYQDKEDAVETASPPAKDEPIISQHSEDNHKPDMMNDIQFEDTDMKSDPIIESEKHAVFNDVSFEDQPKHIEDKIDNDLSSVPPNGLEIENLENNEDQESNDVMMDTS